MRTPTRLVTAAATTVLVMASAPAVSAQAKVPGSAGQLAFARFDPSLGDTVTYTVNPDGTGVHRLFPGASGSPRWSPDGSRIAIGACADPPVCDTEAVIVDPVTGASSVLTQQDPATLFTFCNIWSADGSRLACEGDGQTDIGLNGVYSVRSSDGRGLTRITTNPTGGIDIPIDYSPNGHQLVFARSDASRPPRANAALYVVNTDGSNVHRITPWGFVDDDGSWSPDGAEIAFEHSGALFTVHPDGTDLTQIRLAVNGARYDAGDFSWSPTGTQISFLLCIPSCRNPVTEGIATAHADGTDVDLLTTSPTFDHQADWGPHQPVG